MYMLSSATVLIHSTHQEIKPVRDMKLKLLSNQQVKFVLHINTRGNHRHAATVVSAYTKSSQR